jgi:hypothetical protein
LWPSLRPLFSEVVVVRIFLWVSLVVSVACAVAVSLSFPQLAAAQPPPTITDFGPASGPVGTQVVIDGANFIPPLSIIFGGNVSSQGSFTSSKITVTVPSGAQTGPIQVAASNGTVSTASNFTVTQGTQTTLLSAVLPASRSVQVGNAATAFLTVINTGANVGMSCGLSLGTSIPAAFSFQTTDPTTNAAIGTSNTPVNIPVNGSQSYVFAITPSSAFAPTDVVITASCSNSPAAPTNVGLNTLLLSASTTPVPDIVALAATASNDGIVDIPSTAGSSGAFAVASVNVGSGSTVTVSTDTGAANLPLLITICQTNPSNGQCLAPPASTVSTTINTNDTPTFSIFVAGSGTVSFDPANNRVFVRYRDAGGITRGSTSVAVRTQ